MLTKDKFNEILLGNISAFSGIERSRILFSASTIIIVLLASLVFLVYDIYLGYLSSLWVYSFFIIVFGVALYLLRSGKYIAGLSLLLVALNFFIYIVMSSIPEDSMSAIFYLGIIVFEYVLLGHENKRRLFALFGLSLTLYGTDAFVEFSLLPMRQYDETTLKINKVVDFLICAFVIVVTIKLLIDYLQTIIAAQIKTNEELHRLNIELDKYAYTITHDVKGPVQSMQSLIYMLEKDPENTGQYLSMMKQSFENLSGLIEDVTERARSRNFEVRKEKFNILESVERIWDLSRHASDAQGIALVLDIPEALTVETDKSRVTGILNNLITNAIRYHDKSKDNPFIKVGAYVEQDWLNLSVEDNGIGIDPKHQERVFEMFYRASSKLGGTGLGLFTVKESVGQLSGEITLESTAEKGTTFRMKIPC